MGPSAQGCSLQFRSWFTWDLRACRSTDRKGSQEDYTVTVEDSNYFPGTMPFATPTESLKPFVVSNSNLQLFDRAAELESVKVCLCLLTV